MSLEGANLFKPGLREIALCGLEGHGRLLAGSFGEHPDGDGETMISVGSVLPMGSRGGVGDMP